MCSSWRKQSGLRSRTPYSPRGLRRAYPMALLTLTRSPRLRRDRRSSTPDRPPVVPPLPLGAPRVAAEPEREALAQAAPEEEVLARGVQELDASPAPWSAPVGAAVLYPPPEPARVAWVLGRRNPQWARRRIFRCKGQLQRLQRARAAIQRQAAWLE
ncbi:hypothetical protein ARTHRO9V_190089 [Arthrobacter sp. 9V]|nr:hypothetical protein ARTHRO9V_190089 [Arthrobacter sp. 9V]